MHYVVLVNFAQERKEEKLLFVQENFEVTFHINITSLWIVFGLSMLISDGDTSPVMDEEMVKKQQFSMFFDSLNYYLYEILLLLTKWNDLLKKSKIKYNSPHLISFPTGHVA